MGISAISGGLALGLGDTGVGGCTSQPRRFARVRPDNSGWRRWPIEILFRESNQNLGQGDWQTLRYRGIERYLHLVVIAHLPLTYLGATEPGAQADCAENDPLRLPSVPRLQQLPRSKLWDDIINAMEKGSRNR